MAALEQTFPTFRGLTRLLVGDPSRSYIVAIASVLLFVLNGELMQALQTEINPPVSPVLNIWLCHTTALFLIPYYLGKLQWQSVACFGSFAELGISVLLITILLMVPNTLWVVSTRFQSVGTTNALYQTSGAFVFVMGLLTPAAITSSEDGADDRRTVRRKAFAVVLCVSGAIISRLEVNASGLHFEGGCLWCSPGPSLALAAAFGTACYQVLFRVLFKNAMNSLGALGFVWLWIAACHVLVILPLMVLVDRLGIADVFKFPNTWLGTFAVLGTACVATVVNILQTVVVIQASPLVLACGTALMLPFTRVADLAIRGTFWHTPFEAAGDFLVVLGFLVLTGISTLLWECVEGSPRTPVGGKGPSSTSPSDETAESVSEKC